MLAGVRQGDGAVIVNGTFDGNLAGWQQDIRTTIPIDDPAIATAEPSVRESFLAPNGETLTATDGSHFAFFEATAHGNPQEYHLVPTVVLSQFIDAEAGDRIVGDYFASLWKDGTTSSSEFSVVLLDGAPPGLGAPVATVVHPRTWPGEDTVESLYLPWMEFEYTFDAAGTYWLQAYVQAHNSGTTGEAMAFAGVDNIRFEPIPEPATPVMLIVGAVGLVGHGWRRRRTASSTHRRQTP